MNRIIMKSNLAEQELNLVDNKIVLDKDDDIDLEYKGNDVRLVFDVRANTHVNLSVFSIDNEVNIDNVYNIGSNASLNITKFYHNKEVCEKEVFNLNGENAKIEYHFANIALGNENYNISINHKANSTVSDIVDKTITIEDASVNFNIDSNLQEKTENCILNQESRIILLGNNCSSINPNMYINNNEVIAKHASVIGTFSFKDLFYLMTRGISYEDSLKLLIKGFIFSSISTNMEKRERILKIINDYWR